MKQLDLKMKFGLALGLQVVVILALVLFKLSIVSGGTEVVLKIAPVDPRDPLRGDFVTFRYEELSEVYYYPSRFAAPSGRGETNIKVGETVYVSLIDIGQYWVDGQTSTTKPTSGVFLKGTVTDVGQYGEIDVEYGIEQYFIPEGTGRGVRFTDETYAQVIVDDDGNAVLNAISIDGEPWP